MAKLFDNSAAAIPRSKGGRLFVSYAHDSVQHCERVAVLVNRLKQHCSAVSFDQDHPAEGPSTGWATWSAGEAEEAERVLIVASAAYAKCWLGQHPPGMRDGATWEACCLVNRCYQSGASLPFVRVVIFEDGDVVHVPLRLRGLQRFHGERDIKELAAWLENKIAAPANKVATTATVAGTAAALAPAHLNSSNSPIDFDVSRPSSGSSFVGRREEMAELELLLERKHSYSLTGDSCIGKSSLILAWQDAARRAGRVAHTVDCQAISVALPEFLHAATGGVVSVRSGMRMKADEAADILKQWAMGLSHPPLILIDESEAAVRGLEYRFFERLRAMLGTVLLVFASRHSLPEVFEKRNLTSPFANRLMTWRLGLLDDDGAAELAGRAGEYAGLLRHWAGNHPYYLNALGAWLHRVGPSLSVADALRHFRETANNRLLEAWNQLGKTSRKVLEQVSNGLPMENDGLIARGLLNREGRPFGHVLQRWLQERD